MTVSYQYEVASSTSGGFTRLLFMWRGSLYKLIYRELLLFLFAFGILSALYRNLFTVDQKRLFEKVVVYCDTFINLIPLSFVLGFYVAYVAARWWNQYLAIPWPDRIMHSIALYVQGHDDHARMTRRTLMRYLNLSLILVLRSISSAVKRRFPKMDHLVEAGFMTHSELTIYQSVPSIEFNTYWIPCTWFIHLLRETRRSNRISDPQGLKIIMEEFNHYRSQCGMLWSYDWVSIPLVYTQVVTIATYSFFLAALVGRQYVDEERKTFQMEIDIYLPVFTILQFFFYMGLLKVAEQLINPFGDDDEDFELNWLIDRHTKVSYLGVDTLMTRCPPLVKDMYYNDVDLTLPYTEAAVAYKKKTYRGSVHNMVVPEEQHGMFLPEIEEEDEEATKTPKTSILSLHKVGLPGQKQQQQQQQDLQQRQQQPSSASRNIKSAAGIWRRSSDKSRQGEAATSAAPVRPVGAVVGTPSVDQAGGADGADGEPKRSSVTEESEVHVNSSVPVHRNESFHSWKSFFSSMAGSGPGSRKDQDSSSTNPSPANSEASIASSEDDDDRQVTATAAAVAMGPRNSHSSSGSSSAGVTGAGGSGLRRNSSPLPRPGRPRLQSCPKLLVLVGRHDSTSSAASAGRDGRKKGVRWKPVLDDVHGSVRRRRGSDDDDFLCRGCRERRVGGGLPVSILSRSAPACLRRPTVRRRPGSTAPVTEEPELLGSAPDLGTAADFVRDESYWRGGKFPGTGSGLACGQRAGSRGILKKMMFWRGVTGEDEGVGSPAGPSRSRVGGMGRVARSDGGEGSAAGGLPYTASAGNVMESVIVTVEPSPVSISLPDIASMRTLHLQGMPTPSFSTRPPGPGPGEPDEAVTSSSTEVSHESTEPRPPRQKSKPPLPLPFARKLS